jgi:glycosyltransferase involved in cell wall biosynthesis
MFVNLVAPINPLGYGVVGFNVLKHLMEAGHNVSLWPIGGKATWESNQKSVEQIQGSINNANFFDPEAPSLRIWHQHDMAMFPGKGQRIGMPIFELDEFTDKELHHLESVDRLFVCSDWAKAICEKHGLKNVDVIPLGVDGEVFFPSEEDKAKRPYWTKKSTVFINVGKWEVRKGHNELLEAFNKAFGPDDDVQLWMLNHNPFIGMQNEQWKLNYINTPLGGKIKMLPRVETQAQLRQLFNQVDFGVFPSHAEGWNLEPLELMACGVPSIVTNYSGHSQFCDSANSLLVQPNGMEKAQDGKWFTGQGSWCTFDIDELVAQMRQAHNMKQTESSELLDLQRNAKASANGLSWGNTVTKIIEATG